MRKGVRGPLDKAHRIPFGLKQLLQVLLQRWVGLQSLFRPAARLADPPLRSRPLSFQFFDPSLHRFPIRTRQLGYLADATIPNLERFGSQVQSPLLFIQFFPQNLLLLLCRHSLTIPWFLILWKLFVDVP